MTADTWTSSLTTLPGVAITVTGTITSGIRKCLHANFKEETDASKRRTELGNLTSRAPTFSFRS